MGSLAVSLMLGVNVDTVAENKKKFGCEKDNQSKRYKEMCRKEHSQHTAIL